MPLKSLALLFFPPTCDSCNASLATPAALCDACSITVELNTALHDVTAPYLYGGAIANMIVAAKFARRQRVAQHLGQLLVQHPRVLAVAQAAQAIVPIPLSAKRYRQRGYNQATIIARELSRAVRVPVRYLLKRTKHAPPQSDLPLRERRSNVQGAFRAKNQGYSHVVVVDDVVTSGATVANAIAALKQVDIGHVDVIAIARAMHD